ncbi:MAG TPA: hypothetical protein VGK67_03860 [Myxococcales bacterium]|jgi:predicted nucleic acid-binding protein
MKLVFDTSVLSCFARAELLDVLEQVSRSHERLVPRAVLGELKRGLADYPKLATVLDATWLEEVPVDALEELTAFAHYARRLSAGDRNIGEACVLAWAEVHEATAVVDDQVAVQCARERGVQVVRSLAFVSTGLKKNLFDEARARHVVDALVKLGGARFPCDGAGFVAWARQNGLL